MDYALGKKISPDEKEKGINFTQTYSWIYEAAYSHWPNDVSFYTAASMNSRKNFILQGLGPYALFWADDLPSGIFLYIIIISVYLLTQKIQNHLLALQPPRHQLLQPLLPPRHQVYYFYFFKKRNLINTFIRFIF